MTGLQKFFTTIFPARWAVSMDEQRSTVVATDSTSAGAIASAASSTSTGMPVDLAGLRFRHT